MSTNTQGQEIDLDQVLSRIKGFFQSIVDSIFDFIFFLKRNLIIVSILFILGVSIGFYLDQENKNYSHQIIVKPNFGSVDYLYSKVTLLAAKKKEGDTIFFKSLGFKNIDKLGKIEIEPIIDVFKFVDEKPDNFDMIKLMAENGDLEKIIKNEVTSKNYPFHKIVFSTSEQTTNNKTVAPLLDFLNNSEYYTAIQKQYIENEAIKMKDNDTIIKQIDKLIESFTSSSTSTFKTDKMVYISDNNQLSDILKTKEELLKEQGNLRLSLIYNDKIIKKINASINILDSKGLNGNKKLILPFIFIGVFFILSVLKRFYKKQIQKRKLA